MELFAQPCGYLVELLNGLTDVQPDSRLEIIRRAVASHLRAVFFFSPLERKNRSQAARMRAIHVRSMCSH